MAWKPVTDWLIYLAVRMVVCLIQAMSVRMGYAVARALGRLAYTVDRRHRAVALENLSHAFPGVYSPAQLEALVRSVYVHFASIIVEIAQIPRRLRATNWRDYIQVRNQGPLLQLMLGDRPVILLTAHFGNWEMAGYAMAVFGLCPHSVARSLDNPYLEALLRRFRTKTGQRIIYKRGAFDQVAAVMQHGGLVAFLSDQDAGHRGVFVQYFGRLASSHKGVALLALQHDAPICVGFARRIRAGFHYEVWMEEVIDPRDDRHSPDPVRSLTQQCAWATERVVRLNPEQYLWLHRRWKHRPSAELESQAA
jgi:KDO2-lipid IV(A) lauroyltransferase